jgi:hypothetical protein
MAPSAEGFWTTDTYKMKTTAEEEQEIDVLTLYICQQMASVDVQKYVMEGRCSLKYFCLTGVVSAEIRASEVLIYHNFVGG